MACLTRAVRKDQFFGETKFKKTFETPINLLSFDGDSKYVISFDTDRSLLIQICEISVKKAKNDDPRKVCLGISQVANVF
jgi:hypothetical protein